MSSAAIPQCLVTLLFCDGVAPGFKPRYEAPNRACSGEMDQPECGWRELYCEFLWRSRLECGCARFCSAKAPSAVIRP